MVDAYKKGKLKKKDVSKSVVDAAKGMTKKEIEDFAKTKHKGLPNHVNECENTFESELSRKITETVQTELVKVLGKYVKGKTSSKKANQAIMNLANSMNERKCMDESLMDFLKGKGIGNKELDNIGINNNLGIITGKLADNRNNIQLEIIQELDDVTGGRLYDNPIDLSSLKETLSKHGFDRMEMDDESKSIVFYNNNKKMEFHFYPSDYENMDDDNIEIYNAHLWYQPSIINKAVSEAIEYFTKDLTD